MNHSWETFLHDVHVSLEDDSQIVFPSIGLEGQKRIYPITSLGILTVAGNDAAKFLQGQITCNVNDISDIKSGFGAFCTPKGRVITTFLLCKTKGVYYLVIPDELLAVVKKRLQMYILRSDVILTDSSEDLCLIGLLDSHKQAGSANPTEPVFTAVTLKDAWVRISFPKNRYLIITEARNAIALWSDWVGSQHFTPASPDEWGVFDIISGIPWLTITTSEEFIPQMLNIDKLGGISFNKGCYTGQEIVARTHYLGKAKREMVLAECITHLTPEPNTVIFDDNVGEEEVVGRVVQAQNVQNICKMLIVLKIAETKTYNLKLKSDDRNKITVLTL
jgi:folate-binding protein YgfZ